MTSVNISRKRPREAPRDVHDKSAGRCEGEANARQRGLINQLLEHRAWILSAMNCNDSVTSTRELRALGSDIRPAECSFCRPGAIQHFNAGGTAAEVARFEAVNSSDTIACTVASLVEQLSLDISRDLSTAIADGFKPRCAEGWQFSFGGSRGFHMDAPHLGRLILTITLSGDCAVEVEDSMAPQPKLHRLHPPWHRQQSPTQYYAIWGRSREHIYSNRHRVIAGTQPRLSLTLRFDLRARIDRRVTPSL